MKFLQKVKFRPVFIILLGLWLCNSAYATTVDPSLQFLEVANYSDEAIIIIVVPEDNCPECPYWIVEPRKRKRIPNALEPGLRSLGFGMVTGKNDVLSRWDKVATTKDFPVNNYGNKTFLHGKLFTYFSNEDFTVETVGLLHGAWSILGVDAKKVVHEAELELSHSDTHFSGTINYQYAGQNTTVSGSMGGLTISFKIRTPDASAEWGFIWEESEIRVYPNKPWEGYLNTSAIEDGEREPLPPLPLRFDVDYNKKTLTLLKTGGYGQRR